MTRRILIFSGVALAYMLARSWEQRPVDHPPGILVTSTPTQISGESRSLNVGDFTLRVRARFEIEARVLSSRRYYLGREASLSPLDLALGWGPMSDGRILEQLDISQSGRWYRYRYKLPGPISDTEIIYNSANMHMIPAGSAMERQLKSIRVGEIVKIRGLLVDVDDNVGWSWRTSLSRADTGAGACEIVYVESISLVPGPKGP